MSGYPQRIVCLTAETTEIAFALGAGDRVVGVSGYSVRPPEARRKPKVGAYTTVKLEKILALGPDLVLGFSDLQKDIARDLVAAGLTVLILNQRSLAETAQAIRIVGGTLGLQPAGEAVAEQFEWMVESVRGLGAALPRRPRVFFEEWDDPLISGIRWVSELIDAAGGEDIFPELQERKVATDRIVSPDEVVRRDPELIVASWCGKKANLDRIARRPGWGQVAAVKAGRVHEIKSANILQPGPSLLHGLRELHTLIAAAAFGR